MTGIILRERRGGFETQTQRERLCRDRGGDRSEAAVSQGRLEPPRSQEGPGTDPPSEPLERTNAVHTLILDFHLLNCEGVNSCCYKPPSLW